ncbi:MAG: hydrogenase formation protein HypD [Synergistetes bacterium]|nr:MAG: Hydrogenase isoenzymes formation protein HypD [bacterium 42_11]MBC7332331.1 hydrogenase formation protein HypD [Synergistota bacterium]MDK2871699.1 hydrogenase expression/formation protein HypD [bacterium]
MLGEKLKNIKVKRHLRFMEVCGTHTVNICRFGLRNLFPEEVELRSGPGCPVCVTPASAIKIGIDLALKNDKFVITTYGDMMKVPGPNGTLADAKAKGGKVFSVYSITEALSLAEKNEDLKVIFLAVGFETTAPASAWAIKEAKLKNIKNFFLLSFHKLVPPAMELLASEGTLDGFLCPGHVSTIIGTEVYKNIARKYKIPCVISGFEAEDIIFAMIKLIEMAENEAYDVFNAYKRAVKKEGNKVAQGLLNEVFEEVDSEWRGIGVIPKSGLDIKEEYADFDAKIAFNIEKEDIPENPACKCGEVLKGYIYPYECPLFGKSCIPEHPIGPCMISSEGSCAAYYRYGGRLKDD